MAEPTLVERLRAHAAHLYALTSDSGEADDEMAAAARIEAIEDLLRVWKIWHDNDGLTEAPVAETVAILATADEAAEIGHDELPDPYGGRDE
jgi:hypothetical protein